MKIFYLKYNFFPIFLLISSYNFTLSFFYKVDFIISSILFYQDIFKVPLKILE